jgi:hypothetical protein
VLSDGEWTRREDLYDVIIGVGVTTRTFERALQNLAKSGAIERERAAGTNFWQIRKIAPTTEVTPVEPEIAPSTDELAEALAEIETAASLKDAIVGRSIADRYADVLLAGVENFLANANGSTDWGAIEPVLSRLDKLAGVSFGE